MTVRTESATRLSSITLPLAASLVVTGGAMVLACQFELGSTLSWGGLLVFPLVCAAIAACLHVFTVVVVRGMLDRRESLATWPLLYGTWIPVVWVPALAVLGKDRSMWVVVVLPVMAALIAALLHRWASREDDWYVVDGDLQSLFMVPDAATLRQTLLPALVAALAAEGGVMALAGRRDWGAGCLLAVACVLPVWRFPRKRAARLGRRGVVSSATALLVMAIALLPFLKHGAGHAALDALLQREQMKAASAKAPVPHPGAGYSGVILLLPPKPREAVLPPPPNSSSTATQAKPLLIKFDGAYWYFKEPDERPRRDARIVHGDPLKAHINSTNELALLMEAHQAILPAVKLSCCSAVEVNVANADVRSGEIFVEVLLRDTEAKGKPAISLGTQVIPSSTAPSIAFDRPTVHETLTFRIPRNARAKLCSEITVKIKPSRDRERAASQVSVESFVLVP
jgi:hypothetical protein